MLRVGHAPQLLADDPAAAHAMQASAREGWWPPQFSTFDYFWAVSRADVLLYEERGRGGAAQRELDPLWARGTRAQWAPIDFWATELHNARWRAALALAAVEADRGAALRAAQGAASRLARIQTRLARGLAELAHGAVAAAWGAKGEASARFAGAEAALDAVGCAHYAAAAKRRRGLILAGDEGRALVDAADARLRAEGARDPARLAAMLAPGAP